MPLLRRPNSESREDVMIDKASWNKLIGKAVKVFSKPANPPADAVNNNRAGGVSVYESDLSAATSVTRVHDAKIPGQDTAPTPHTRDKISKKLFVSGSKLDIKSQYSKVLHSEDLTQIKGMLIDVIRENYELKQELLKRDSKFLQLQIDHVNSLLRRKPKSKESTVETSLKDAEKIEKDLKVRLAKTEIELIETSTTLREMEGKNGLLVQKVEQLENENRSLKRSHAAFAKSITEKNEVLENRCRRTDTRRRLEQSGLLEEIRECRTLLRILSRNSSKVFKLVKEKSSHNRMDKDKEEMVAVKTCRLAKYLLKSDPAVAQTAMSVWEEYLQRRINGLEDKVSKVSISSQSSDEETETGSDSSFQVVYSKKTDNNPSLLEDDHFHYDLVELKPRSSLDDESGSQHDIDCQYPPPSPNWMHICNQAGLAYKSNSSQNSFACQNVKII